jgi:hypothetical protein
MSIEQSPFSALEQLLDQMHRIMTEYIALHEDEKNEYLIFQKAKELEAMHKLIQSKMDHMKKF